MENVTIEKYTDHKRHSLKEWRDIATGLGLEIVDGASKKEIMEMINEKNGFATDASADAAQATDGTQATGEAPKASNFRASTDVTDGTVLEHTLRGVVTAKVTKQADGYLLDVDGKVYTSLTSAAIAAERIRQNNPTKKLSINGRDYFGLPVATQRGPRDPSAPKSARASSLDGLKAKLAKLIAARDGLNEKIAATEQAVANWTEPSPAIEDELKAAEKQIKAEAKLMAAKVVEEALAKKRAEILAKQQAAQPVQPAADQPTS